MDMTKAQTASETFFFVQRSVHRVIFGNNYPTRCNNVQFIYISRLLYMFQVVSTVSGINETVTVDTVIWAPDDGWRYHPKHVEQSKDINKLYIVASCWINIATSSETLCFNKNDTRHLTFSKRCCEESSWKSYAVSNAEQLREFWTDVRQWDAQVF